MPSNFTLFCGTTATADAQPLLLEINGDGHPDLLLPQTGATLPADDPAYQPRAFLNDGYGGCDRAHTLPVIPLSVGAAGAADFDRDGRLDVFLGGRQIPGRYPEPAPCVLLMNRNGRFELSDRFPDFHGPITAALATDVDADGWLDLLLACEWGTVTYLHNDAEQSFTDRSATAGFTSTGTGWWNSLATADFNHDDRLDYAVGNAGLNTLYTAPVTLLSGPFADNESNLLIETILKDGQHYPRHSLTVLTALVPSLKRRNRTHDAYAPKPITALFSTEQLAAARTFTATNLSSGIFLSQPSGTFVFTPFPRLAQIAPTYSLVATDLDGDTFTDLVGVQNLYSVRPETGRFDGGLGYVLYGDGTGAFSLAHGPQPTIQHDAKALALIDLHADGHPDRHVTRNQDTTLAIPTANGHRLALKLIGPPENPPGIGTRITLVYE
ncbi:MAG: VCBS repeat-containing protein [Candidatus Synoicihabitans palmerolidicus]|nr:VCBS repeat-containing protein [Candidatus Synoicihabitans palmerolidicus]